jgi:hypothetical protein
MEAGAPDEPQAKWGVVRGPRRKPGLVNYRGILFELKLNFEYSVKTENSAECSVKNRIFGRMFGKKPNIR